MSAPLSAGFFRPFFEAVKNRGGKGGGEGGRFDRGQRFNVFFNLPLISEEAVCRTAPATPGLLKIVLDQILNSKYLYFYFMFLFSSFEARNQ